MAKILAVLLIGILLLNTSYAQYYYKDLISNKQATADIAKFKENKVRNIRIKSFEDDGSPSEGFFGERRFSNNYKKSEVYIRVNVAGSSILTTNFNDKGLLVTSHDSSEIASSRTTYTYDADDRIKKITTSIRSSDDDFHTEIQEEHIYVYEEEFLPTKMIRVKNRSDSTTILFLHDENNNISIEKDTKTGSKYYYYYDEKSRLTDIAHANEYKPKLIANYLFEYTPDGQISQMTTTEEGNRDYFIWKYTYANGMRTSEKCYTKERKLMGSIVYEYK